MYTYFYHSSRCWKHIPQNSPGALSFNLEKNVESWNFQESYLDAHQTPWWKSLKIPAEENFLFKMAAIATDSLLL